MLTRNNKSQKYFKVIHSNFSQRGFQYNIGLNEDHREFNPDPRCGPGGLYFCVEDDVVDWIGMGELVVEVEIPNNATFVSMPNKLKADKLILTENVSDRVKWLLKKYSSSEDIKNIIVKRPKLLTYFLSKIDSDICKHFIENVRSLKLNDDLNGLIRRFHIFENVDDDYILNVLKKVSGNCNYYTKYLNDHIQNFNQNFANEILRIGFNNLHCIPGEYVNEAAIKYAITNNPYNSISDLPREYFTDEIIFLMLNSTLNLRDIPKHLITEKHVQFCFDNITKYSYILKYIPEKLLTRDMVLKAITFNESMESVYHLYGNDKEICLAALKKRGRRELNYMVPELRNDPEIQELLKTFKHSRT